MAYSSITKPTDYFNSVLYTGDDTAIGSGGNAITGVGFQPDFVWIKRRTSDAAHHAWYDIVRGTTKQLGSSQNSAETTQSEGLTTFGTDGFTVGSLGRVNEGGGDTYVAWNWKAGGSASSNSNGSITSSVSANTTAGFSIVSYTGTGSVATVGHGLGVAPKFIIVKTRSLSNEAWPVDSRANSGITYLNETSTKGAYGDSSPFPSTAPTSTVFSIGTPNNTNGSGATYIAYCFADVKGYSKFGTYVANANTDGPFVYTGFKPAFVLVQNTSVAQGWFIMDNKRNTFNEVTKGLSPNTNSTENDSSANNGCDFLSNGFKVRAVGTGDINHTSGNTYIYMAFAENPFVGNDSGTAVPVVAR